MYRIARTGCVAALLLLVGACSLALDVPGQRAPSSAGTPFTQGLAGGYRNLSQSQANEYDWVVADIFARKSLRAGEGIEVQPELPGTWRHRIGGNVIEPFVPELQETRTRLLTRLDGGGRERTPTESANAQVAFDCWVEEASEPSSDDDLTKCRNTVIAFLTPAIAQAATQPSPPPIAAAAALPESYLVFFAFDQSDISPVSAQVLDKVVGDFQRTGAAQVDVQGYTDLSGPADYNLKLSQRRADAVKRYLLAHGVKTSEIRTEWFGETRPRVPTADGARNQENRRAEIYIKK